jgi:hypothetical protein
MPLVLCGTYLSDLRAGGTGLLAAVELLRQSVLPPLRLRHASGPRPSGNQPVWISAVVVRVAMSVFTTRRGAAPRGPEDHDLPRPDHQRSQRRGPAAVMFPGAG